MGRKHHRRQKVKMSLSTGEKEFDEAFELLAFEGAEPLTDELVEQLIDRGWKDVLSAIQAVAPRCEHGGCIAFYSSKRKSILFPGPEEFTSFEITQDTIQLHALTLGAKQIRLLTAIRAALMGG
jgi:hypothetical protein